MSDNANIGIYVFGNQVTQGDLGNNNNNNIINFYILGG